MKTYSQYCPVAHALDLVGERWSLLIVRELLKGPLRYTDLACALPGCGTNILAARLEKLDAAGVVVKTKLPPPAASTVYELTEYGHELDEALYALGRWGARSLGPPKVEEELRPGWSVDAVRCTFKPEEARDLDATYEFRFGGDEITTAVVRDGQLESWRGHAEQADLVVETNPPTMFELVAKTLTPEEVLADGRVRIEGDPADFERLISLFSFEPLNAGAPAAA